MTDSQGLETLDKTIVRVVQADIKRAEAYQASVVEKAVRERYSIYFADKDYYREKFPILSKTSSLVSTDVADTIEWALPSLMKVFTGSDEVITVAGVTEEDDAKAEVMQELLVYQLQRQNKFFVMLYNWIKDALITGMGIVKCYWERTEGHTDETVVINQRALEALIQTGVTIVSVEGPDIMGDFTVTYQSPYYIKNSPKIENILVNEFLYSSEAKNLEEANFVAHKKKVTMSYLREREKQGIYANVDDIKTESLSNSIIVDSVEDVIGDGYRDINQEEDEARKEVTIYECYTKIDINNDGILEDMIITICEDTILRIEQNYMGRHPFFMISPTKDPHRIWVKRSYAELIGELQDLKVALTRQIMQNVALTNDPKMILSEDAINIDDFVQGRKVIRKKPGHQMNEVAMPVPIQPLSPYTFQFLEYIEGQKENRTGITRYNQGLDANSLNKMLALDTPIPLIDGSYKLNKDIVEGDVLVGSDGKGTKVLKAHPIQNPKRAFKITFETGDVIKAGGEHRWSVKVATKSNHHKSPDWEKLPTERIYDLMQTGHKVWIPRVFEVDFTEKDLPIDPYVFGAWLGDGNSHTNRFTTMDNEVKCKFEEWSKTLKDRRYEEYKYNVKHIPEIFLQGSFKQRLALLQGLMDTDGYITKDGQSVFCNSEPALVEGVVKLLNSFGIKATVSWRENVSNKFENCRPHAHVYFSSPFCPVTIQYKVDRWKTKSANRWEQQRIVSIEEIDIEPMRCLTVDAEDELYACGNIMTLTSNTATGISAILGQSSQRLELIARMFAETGIYELFRFMVSLNQKFIDQDTVIRLTNKELKISPDDLNGNFDLVVNAGISIATKESTIMATQTLLTALMQANAGGYMVSTPENIYNLFKKWIENIGFKNYGDYITDPAVTQQRTMMEMQLKQQVLASLPPEAMQMYMTTGQLPSEYLMQLPPQLQLLFGGVVNQPGTEGISSPSGFGGGGFGGTKLSGGLAGGLSRVDNQQPQNVPREGNGPVQEPPTGVGGF